MDIKVLEKDELVELAETLASSLGDRIMHECVLKLRIKNLEKLIDEDRVRSLEKRIEELEGQKDNDAAWEKLVDDYERVKGDLENVKAQWRELVNDYDKAKERTGILEQANDSLAETGKRHLADAQRLEKELREARTTVMNEVSAMIPKAVEAEREACADLARRMALQCVSMEGAGKLMDVTNAIKERGVKK